MVCNKCFLILFKVCGGVVKSISGYITSPYYPRNYPSSIRCEWLIVVDENYLIDLTIIDIDISIDPDCKFDKFLIYDGDSVDSDQIFKFCGKRNINGLKVTSLSNKLLVIFESNEDVGVKGFRLHYKKVELTFIRMYHISIILYFL